MTGIPLPQPLRHRFTIDPIPARKAASLAQRTAPGRYEGEEIPDHIRNAVQVLEEAGDRTLLSGGGAQLWFPRMVPRPIWFGMARGYSAHLASVYTLPGFVEIPPGGTVVDCGAFIGGFSIAAARAGARVIAVEPAPVSFDCLRRNTDGLNVTCLNLGLSDREGRARFSLKDNPTDNSLLPDDGIEIGSVDITLTTLPALLAQQGLERADFVKVEAEGMELEVLADVTPRIAPLLAIAAGPERMGHSPLLDIAVMLAGRGYRLANRNYFLFAQG